MQRLIGPALGLLIAAHAHAASTPAPVILRLKPDPAGKDYQIETSTAQTRGFPDGTEKKDEISTRVVVNRKVAAVEGGLEVQTTTQEILIAVKDLVSKVPAKPDVSKVLVSDRGEPRIEGTPKDPSELLQPVFPEGEVKAGLIWKSQVPSTEEFPIGFEMAHKVSKLEESGGQLVAVIDSSGFFPPQKTTLDIECTGNVSGQTTIEVATGAIVKSTSQVTIRMTYPRPTKHGHQSLHKVVSRTVERRP